MIFGKLNEEIFYLSVELLEAALKIVGEDQMKNQVKILL